jgi:hypothetical protein
MELPRQKNELRVVTRARAIQSDVRLCDSAQCVCDHARAAKCARE